MANRALVPSELIYRSEPLLAGREAVLDFWSDLVEIYLADETACRHAALASHTFVTSEPMHACLVERVPEAAGV